MRKRQTVQPIKGGKEDFDASNARVAATLDLQDLDVLERAFLATCQKIYRRDSGSTSPFENFFFSLVVRVESGRWPTPDEVASELEEFREDLDLMRKWTRSFLEAYPEPPAPEQTTQTTIKRPAKARSARKAKRKAA